MLIDPGSARLARQGGRVLRRGRGELGGQHEAVQEAAEAGREQVLRGLRREGPAVGVDQFGHLHLLSRQIKHSTIDRL